MKDALKINIGGLQCDNPECNYINPDIDITEYEQWVNAKCPECGEILLTEEDYRNTKFLLGVVDLANKIFPKREDDDEDAVMTVEMNGTGEMDLNIKDSE